MEILFSQNDKVVCVLVRGNGMNDKKLIVIKVAAVLMMVIVYLSLLAEEKYREIAISAEKYKFTPDLIELKKGETVILSISSEDVNHGFCSKELNIFLEIPAGEEVKYKFTPTKEGSFEFYCCVYCGKGQKKMKGKIIIK